METILLNENRNSVAVIQRDIKYMFGCDNYVKFAIENKVLQKRISLSELEELFDKHLFYRVHKQYIINMLWVQKYEKDMVSIDNKEIMISKRNKKKFELAYIEFRDFLSFTIGG